MLDSPVCRGYFRIRKHKMKKKEISIIIPTIPEKRFNPYKDLNIKKKIKVQVIKGKNPSKNRNIGIKNAKTEFVAFINAHTILSNNWDLEVEKFFQKYPKIDIVGGPQLTPSDESLFAKSSGYALGSIFGSAGIRKRYRPLKLSLDADETMLTSANLICRKRIFKKVIFDENLYPGEDPKFISDAKKAGFSLAYSPKIMVYNKRRTTLPDLAEQIFNYGKVRPYKENFRETLKKPFFLVPPLFLAYIVTLPLTILIHKLFLAPIFLYVVINALFSLYGGIKNKNFPAIFLLFIIFPLIHISYGAGFLYGISTKK